MNMLKKPYTKKQALLKYLEDAMSLRELMRFLEDYAERLGDSKLQLTFDVFSSGPEPIFTDRELRVGPHRNGAYYRVCRVPLPLAELLAACRKAVQDGAIDDQLPVWFRREYPRKPDTKVLEIKDVRILFQRLG